MMMYGPSFHIDMDRPILYSTMRPGVYMVPKFFSSFIYKQNEFAE